MKFIHLTDTHLVRPGQRLHGLDTFERLDLALESIEEAHGDASLCVLTGDFADDPHPAVYAAARERLARFSLPVHLLVGNHDDRAAFRHVFPEAPDDGNGFVQCTVETEAGVFLLLDTVDPGQIAGAYCEARLEWIAARLAEHRDRDVYAFMHHPPFPVGVPVLDAHGFTEPGPLADALAAAGNVRHLFFGHVHRPVSGSFRGVPFSTLFGTNHQIRLDMAPDAHIAFTEEPPAYAVVLIDAERVVAHTHHFTADQSDIRGRE